MRAGMVWLVAGALLFAAFGSAVAHAGPDPLARAYSVTEGYLQSAKFSCASQPHADAELCTQLEPFTVTMHVRTVDHYRIDVSNTHRDSNYRYFAWLLPPGMKLTRIVTSHDGTCGIRDGKIACTRALAAPRCDCSQRDLVVVFTATGREPTRAKGGYLIHYGLVTPILDPLNRRAPVCRAGQANTPAQPCAVL
jgi:hypothetical protein